MKIDKLIETVKKLRDPQKGCDWDRKQTHESLTPYMIEEAYEAVTAIHNKNTENLKEELGDVLFQIVLHAQIASENKKFNINDVVNSINDKMIRRHPHVFKEHKTHLTEKELNIQWQEIKDKEKRNNNSNKLFNDINISQPALLQALYISKEVAKLNFDWLNYNGPLLKIKEELNEIEEEIRKENINTNNLETELGDLLFSIVNLCRHMKINPEIAIIKANNKFKNRFIKMLNLFKNKKEFENSTLNNKEKAWDKVKKL